MKGGHLLDWFPTVSPQPVAVLAAQSVAVSEKWVQNDDENEITAGADASVEALKLYHMKLTLALIQ